VCTASKTGRLHGSETRHDKICHSAMSSRKGYSPSRVDEYVSGAGHIYIFSGVVYIIRNSYGNQIESRIEHTHTLSAKGPTVSRVPLLGMIVHRFVNFSVKLKLKRESESPRVARRWFLFFSHTTPTAHRRGTRPRTSHTHYALSQSRTHAHAHNTTHIHTHTHNTTRGPPAPAPAPAPRLRFRRWTSLSQRW
jgi:hypothetical protein